jgi:hypothetical protein
MLLSRSVSAPVRLRVRLHRDPQTGCLVLVGASAGGYGLLTVAGRTTYAHRYAWELANGPIPGGAWVLHRCDNPPCCEPSHLFLGTRESNQVDMARKNRGRHGTGRFPRSVRRNRNGFQVHVRGKSYGTFPTVAEAARVAQETREVVYG